MDTQIHIHALADRKIAEFTGEGLLLANSRDGLDLLGNIYFAGYDAAILHLEQITPDFFDLKTGIAGEVLQKFSNYRVGLAIVGRFEALPGKSIRDFIQESNKRGHICFVSTVQEALACLKAG